VCVRVQIDRETEGRIDVYLPQRPFSLSDTQAVAGAAVLNANWENGQALLMFYF